MPCTGVARWLLPEALTIQFDARCLLSPRRVCLVHMFVASQSVLASENSAHWPLSTSFIEAETSSLALRLTSSSNKAQSAYSRMLGRLHGERTLTMVSTFQLTRTARLTGAPEYSVHTEKENRSSLVLMPWSSFRVFGVFRGCVLRSGV